MHSRPVHGRRLGLHVHRPLAEIEQFVFQHDDRFIAANGLIELPPGILWRGRYGNAQPRYIHQGLFQTLGMLGGQLPCHPARRAHHQRHGKLPAGHERDLGRHVDNRVQRQQGEVDGHDLHHRTASHQSRAHAQAGKTALGNRRVAHPPFAKAGIQAFRYPVAAAVQPHILAQHEHGIVGLHLLFQRAVERLPVKQFFGHQMSTSC